MIKWTFFQEKIKTLSKEFFKNPPDGRGHGLKCIESKNGRHFYNATFWDRQLCFYEKNWFVSEKTQKIELCRFSQEIYVIKFCPKKENVTRRSVT